MFRIYNSKVHRAPVSRACTWTCFQYSNSFFFQYDVMLRVCYSARSAIPAIVHRRRFTISIIFSHLYFFRCWTTRARNICRNVSVAEARLGACWIRVFVFGAKMIVSVGCQWGRAGRDEILRERISKDTEHVFLAITHILQRHSWRTRKKKPQNVEAPGIVTNNNKKTICFMSKFVDFHTCFAH